MEASTQPIPQPVHIDSGLTPIRRNRIATSTQEHHQDRQRDGDHHRVRGMPKLHDHLEVGRQYPVTHLVRYAGGREHKSRTTSAWLLLIERHVRRSEGWLAISASSGSPPQRARSRKPLTSSSRNRMKRAMRADRRALS